MKELALHYSGYCMEAYISKKLKLKDEDLSTIDWSELMVSHMLLSWERVATCTKFAYMWSYTGSRQHLLLGELTKCPSLW